MITPYKHQQDIINDDPKKVGLFLGTGAGKSFIGLSFAQGKTLIICPKTQREDANWERQLSQMDKKLDLTVISKETFRRDHETLKHFDTVIVDEAHTCLGVTPNTRQRNKVIIPRASQTFEALESFIGRTRPERLYLCTATIVRSPMTVWAAAKLLGKQIDFYKFRSLFYIRLPMPGREVWQAKTDDKTKDMLANLVKKIGYTGRLQDYFDLPPQLYRTIHIELTAKQKARIKDMAIEFPEPIVRVGKIHQIENGVLGGDEFNEAETFNNGKIDTILDLALEFPKMIVFCKYRNQIRSIGDAIRGRTVFYLTGDTQDRGKLFEDIKKADEYILLVQAQISAGWELPECAVMVFASCTYSFVDRIQAEGRILRANNLKKNLYIDLIVKGGIDEAVHDCISNKKDFDAAIYAI